MDDKEENEGVGLPSQVSSGCLNCRASALLSQVTGLPSIVVGASGGKVDTVVVKVIDVKVRVVNVCSSGGGGSYKILWIPPLEKKDRLSGQKEPRRGPQFEENPLGPGVGILEASQS